MRQVLILEPIHNTSTDLLRCFANGKPLTPEHINFLDWHCAELNNPQLDPVLKYYLDAVRRRRDQRFKSSFLVPHEQMNKENIQNLKKRLQIFLKEKNSHVVIPITPKQLEEFQDITSEELIYFHGNQYLTGAPFFPGGIAPVIYFQWGNFFGVVKYCVLAEEKALKANVMIYFEDMLDRDLNRCVADYIHHLQTDIQLQNEMLVVQHQPVHAPESQERLIQQPQPSLLAVATQEKLAQPQPSHPPVEAPAPTLAPTPTLSLGAHFLIKPYQAH